MLVAKLGAKCARCAAASVGLALGLGAGIPGAHAAGILDAPCTTPGQKLIVTDYQGAAIASNGRGHGMAAFVRGKDAAAVDTDYLMLVWSKDSGKGDGGISFYNWDTRHRPGAHRHCGSSSPTPSSARRTARRSPRCSPTTGGPGCCRPPTASRSTTWTASRHPCWSRINWSRAPPTPTTAAAPSGFWRSRPLHLRGAGGRGSEDLQVHRPGRPHQDRLAEHLQHQLLRPSGQPGLGAGQSHRRRRGAGQLRRDRRGHQQPRRPGQQADLQARHQPADPQRLWLDAQRQHPLRRHQAARQQPAVGPGDLRARSRRAGPCSRGRRSPASARPGSYVATQDDYAFVGLSSCVHKVKRDTKGTTSASDDSWAKVSPPPPGVCRRRPPGRSGSSAPTVDFPTPMRQRASSSATTTTPRPAA